MSDAIEPDTDTAGRPRWMAAAAGFCLLTLAFTIPRDLFLPHTRDVEVWLGFELRGGLARATAPLHWAIFALGAWGFWRGRPWVWPWASVYAFYVALSHLIWNQLSPNGGGWVPGLLQAAGLSLVALLFLRLRPPDGGGAD